VHAARHYVRVSNRLHAQAFARAVDVPRAPTVPGEMKESPMEQVVMKNPMELPTAKARRAVEEHMKQYTPDLYL
jgi:hypothetical protein